MNQILYTGGKKGNGGMKDTQKIVVFFVIFIIIFAICLIGLGINLLRKVKNEKPNNNLGESNVTNTTPDTPEPLPEESKIEISFESQLGVVKAIITSTKKIENISYWWDEENPISAEITEINETEDNKYEVEIKSKQGTHTLNVQVTDENGAIETASQLVIGDSEPELTITTDGVSNYVIKAKDDEQIDKIVIVLNDETEEIEVKAKEFEHKVAIPQGYSLIDVTVYNLNGITVNKKAQIRNFGG